eukprot:471448-Lingulodinium_polyedra.AAC.1
MLVVCWDHRHGQWQHDHGPLFVLGLSAPQVESPAGRLYSWQRGRPEALQPAFVGEASCVYGLLALRPG